MICRHGGLTFVRHNEIRDITAEWLERVCHDVVIEPPLQPLTGENVVPATANRQDDARADIHARGFWGRRPRGPTPLEISYACSEITGNHNRNHWKSGNQASRQKS